MEDLELLHLIQKTKMKNRREACNGFRFKIYGSIIESVMLYEPQTFTLNKKPQQVPLVTEMD